MIKTNLKKKKCKKAKRLSEEPVKITERREKQKEKEKGKDIPNGMQFQRLPRRDKKAFLSDQCKEIEENNRMGKTRDTKEIFHAKMGTIKDRNSKHLTEADLEIKKRCQEYTEELYNKSLNDLITTMVWSLT